MPVTAEANPINETHAMSMSAEIADKLNDYSALRDAVEQQQLSDEIQKLGDMFSLGDDGAIKTQFAMLCRARGQQAGLSFSDPHPTPCNVLYFNIAKALYPEASFQTLLGILLPEVTTQWIAECNDDLDIDLVRLKKKSIADLDNNPLVSLPVELDTFRRLVILGHEVFLLDPLAFFNFDLHCQLYSILSERHRPLQQAIAAHNNVLAELYSAIEKIKEPASTSLSELEQKDLATRYTGLGRAPLLDLNRSLTPKSLPVELIRPFYKQIVIPSFAQLQEYLIALPSTEYALFLREALCQFNIAEHLHDLASNLDALDAVIELIPIKDRWGSAVSKKNTAGETVLQAAMRLSTRDALWVILDLLSNNDLLAAITESDSGGNSILLQAEQPGADPEFLQTMLSRLSIEERRAVLSKERITPTIDDHSFYVKCLAGVAMAAGAGFVIKDILESHPTPSPVAAGLLVSGAALASYGLFSTKNSGRVSETSELLNQPVECCHALSQ